MKETPRMTFDDAIRRISLCWALILHLVFLAAWPFFPDTPPPFDFTEWFIKISQVTYMYTTFV